jgi:hypothetical protein
MKLFKNHFYDIIRLYINQIGITIFASMLNTAVTNPDNPELSLKLQIGVSVFATLFFFALLYTMGWDWGATDIIRVESGRQKKTPFKGAALAFFANIINFILAGGCVICMMQIIDGNAAAEPVNQIFNLLLRFTNAMYLGSIKGIFASVTDVNLSFLYQSIGYFVAPIFAIGVTQLGYFLGTKNFKIFGSHKKA